jgi:DNA (cytosine-5)-methyltransferase 1
MKEDGEPAFTLTGQDQHGVLIQTRSDQPYANRSTTPPLRQSDKAEVRIVDGIRIRRLTPLECERLQGFEDNWTMFGIDAKDNVVEISDTQRYKMCGNAVTVNAVEWTIGRIYGED